MPLLCLLINNSAVQTDTPNPWFVLPNDMPCSLNAKIERFISIICLKPIVAKLRIWLQWTANIFKRTGNVSQESGMIFKKFANIITYRSADKSLAQPGRKQTNVSVRVAWISFGVWPCRKKKKTCWQLASRCCWNCARPWHASELVSFLVGLRTYQRPSKFNLKDKI